VSLEKLNGLLVFLGGSPTLERAEVSPLASLRIFLARIESIFA